MKEMYSGEQAKAIDTHAICLLYTSDAADD